MNLDNFTGEIKEALARFEVWWLANHRKDPEQYPTHLDEDNSGLWFEQFLFFYTDIYGTDDETVTSPFIVPAPASWQVEPTTSDGSVPMRVS